MRRLVSAITAFSAAVPASAFAETADELRARGEELAKEGHLTGAIDAFKGADRKERRTSHACLIALAYTRRELWPQAEIFMQMCHERQTKADPAPEWVALADQQLRERIATANVAAVTISVNPASLAASTNVTVSSFAPDEQFTPRTIHLPPGRHLISGTAPGREAAQQTIEITDTKARSVVLDFEPPVVDQPPPPPPPLPERPPVETLSRTVPYAMMVVGGAIVLAGGAYHLFRFRPIYDDTYDAANDPTPAGDARFKELSPKFDRHRNITATIYGVGAAVLITGFILRVTKYADPSESLVQVSLPSVGPDGVIVGLEWRR